MDLSQSDPAVPDITLDIMIQTSLFLLFNMIINRVGTNGRDVNGGANLIHFIEITYIAM